MQEKIQKFSQIKQNILQFIETLNISKRDFYKKTGISRGTLESNTGITEETMTKLFATYDNLNLDWIFYKKGPMLKDNYSVECDNIGKCEKCEIKDKLILTLEQLNKSQARTIELLEEKVSLDHARGDDASVAAAG